MKCMTSENFQVVKSQDYNDVIFLIYKFFVPQDFVDDKFEIRSEITGVRKLFEQEPIRITNKEEIVLWLQPYFKSNNNWVLHYHCTENDIDVETRFFVFFELIE